MLTTPVQDSAIREDRSSHPRVASLRLGKGASFGLGQARVPTDAPLSLHRANERRLPGYVKDHIVPLVCGGPDAVSNMQWRTIREARAKDKREAKGCAR
jgi:hypothetical protein